MAFKFNALTGGFNTFTQADLTSIGGSNDLLFNDSTKVKIGTGNDLEIYHDGTFNYIAAPNNHEVHINANSGGSTENMAKFKPNGAVELYYNNSKKFETYNGGCQMGGDLSFSDSQVANFGTGSDLQIYHDGSNSFIKDSGTGILNISSNLLQIINAAGNEVLGAFTENGAVELYYNNNKKLHTQNGGITVTGSVFVEDNNKFVAGNSEDLQILHDGSNSFVKDAGTGELRLESNAGGVRIQRSSGDTGLFYTLGGSVDLYFDNSKKFETVTGGVKVSGHIYADDNKELRLGNDGDLQLWHGSDSNSRIYNALNTLYIRTSRGGLISSGESEWGVLFTENSSVNLYYDGSEKFKTNSLGIEISGHIYQSDNHKLLLGNAQDLQLYHDGNNSIIGNETGVLIIATPSEMLLRSNTGETMIRGVPNGAAELYYDNSKKVETTSLGVNVEGHLRFNNSTWTGEHADGKIQTHSNNMYFQIPNTSGAEWIFRASDGVNRASINLNGTYSSSDQRLKKDITTITSSVDTIKKLTGRSFTWKEDSKKSFGLIAQEVETVLPDLVMTQQLVDGETNSDPYKMVNYAALTGHLVEAIKELSTKVAALEAA